MQGQIKGFTIIEVVIASLIFFLSIAVISQIFGIAFERVIKIKENETYSFVILNKMSDILDGSERNTETVRVVLKREVDGESKEEGLELKLFLYKIGEEKFFLPYLGNGKLSY